MYEWYVLWFFMLFQKDLKLNVLQIQKSKYQEWERISFSYFKVGVFGMTLICTVYIVVNWFYYMYLTRNTELPKQ